MLSLPGSNSGVVIGPHNIGTNEVRPMIPQTSSAATHASSTQPNSSGTGAPSIDTATNTENPPPKVSTGAPPDIVMQTSTPNNLITLHSGSIFGTSQMQSLPSVSTQTLTDPQTQPAPTPNHFYTPKENSGSHIQQFHTLKENPTWSHLGNSHWGSRFLGCCTGLNLLALSAFSKVDSNHPHP